MAEFTPPSANLAYNGHYPALSGRWHQPQAAKGVCLEMYDGRFSTKGESRAHTPWMLINCPSLRAAPLIFVNLVTNRLTFDSVNTNEPLFCDDSSLDMDLRRISEAAPYPREAARPVAISDLWQIGYRWMDLPP